MTDTPASSPAESPRPGDARRSRRIVAATWGAVAALALLWTAAGDGREAAAAAWGVPRWIRWWVTVAGYLALAWAGYAGWRRARPAAAAATVGGARAWPPAWEAFLLRHCPYYQALDEAARARFRARMDALADAVAIHVARPPGDPRPDAAVREAGVRPDPERAAEYAECFGDPPEDPPGNPEGAARGRYGDDGRFLPRETEAVLWILASGTQLGFGFDGVDWRAEGLREIILRGDAFDEGLHVDDRTGVTTEFEESGQLGEEGVMNGVMVLSLEDLIDDWYYPADGGQVALHEFAHLVDLSVTERLRRETPPGEVPWREAMTRERLRIKRGKSDIDPYALTDEREFLAVMTEAFFSAPRRFRRKHAALHRLLRRAWRQDPAEPGAGPPAADGDRPTSDP